MRPRTIGTQDHDFFAAIGAADPIEDLTARQRVNLPAALDAVLFADLGVEQAQVMINLCNRRDRRFFAALAEPLFDGDGRRDAGDVVDVGPRHHFEKLARVSRQTVDVAALSFGVDDIESKRRLSRTAESGEDYEAVTRYVQADVF